MLNNKQIAATFDLLAKLMELHDENPFKIKSYANAYLSLRKLEGDLALMPSSEMASIQGVGTAIVEKIGELISTGEMQLLNKYKDITPQGVQEMLGVKGLGPKKVKQIWREMEITSVGELLYACNENRLVAYKGFGEKLQEEIKGRIEYFMDAQGKYLYAHLHKHAETLVDSLQQMYPEQLFAVCGDIRRMMPEVQGIEILTTMALEPTDTTITDLEINAESNILTYHGFPVFVYQVSRESFFQELFNKSASTAFLERFGLAEATYLDEETIFSKRNIRFIPSEHREQADVIDQYSQASAPQLITDQDIKGIVHNHSTYSDGLHTLQAMADYVKGCGYEYFVISDHSKSAGYAGGLNEDRVFMQMKEVDDMNASYGDSFKVFKSIESDILVDGSLDYSDEVLGQFDLVIASIHSVLNMDIDKATNRLIKAVENPYTRILGHPTSRLLLSRAGYPVDYKKVIDACAANGVAMELNANPQRLDMDWTWIPYALEKNVYVSINPDAHSKASIHYVHYGVCAARKGGLTKDMCLNTKSALLFAQWIKG